MKNCFLIVIATIASGLINPPLDAVEPCRIEVVDRASGWPVPLVELRTVSGHRLVSDNAGLIACDLPELFGNEVWFEVIGHGYGVPKDGFGFRGIRLRIEPAGTHRVEVDRQVIAKRIGRLTGSGLFAESQKLGMAAPISESGIIGCDSVQNAIHQGKIFWFWGDSNLARYPLGIFQSTGATTSLTPLASFQPPLQLSLEVFRDTKQQPRGVALIPGKGPTWLSGVVSLNDRDHQTHLVATYTKIEPPLTPWQKGLVEWNPDSNTFELLKVLWDRSQETKPMPEIPEGHASFWTDPDAGGRRWVLFGNPFPTLRMPATYEAWQDPQQWEMLKPQTQLRAVRTGEGTSDRDAEMIEPHTGSIAWNAFRHRWVTVFMQKFGKPSAFGEIWYSEANEPMGPWGPAIKVLTHQNYTFYNPRLHPELTPEGSPHLFFEGTYTILFTGARKSGGLVPDFPQPTPRYEYNQVLYRLDLDDPEVAPAQLRQRD